MPFDNSPSNHVDTSLAALIAWLEKQPANGTYSPKSPKTCLLGQHFSAMARRQVTLDYDFGSSPFEYVAPRRWFRPALRFNGRPFTFVAIDPPHTFGAALDRARKLALVS